MKSLSKYRKAQKTFGKLFLVFFSVFFISIILVILPLRSQNDEIPQTDVIEMPSNNTNQTYSPELPPATTTEYGFPLFLTTLILTGTLSLFSTVFTFLGFIATTIFAWRKEKREIESFRFESEKKEIEIEKLKIELEKSKNTIGTKIKKCTNCNRTYSDVSLNFCLDDGAVLSEIHNSEEFMQNPSEKTLIMESNLPTQQTEAKTEIIKNKTTAK